LITSGFTIGRISTDSGCCLLEIVIIIVTIMMMMMMMMIIKMIFTFSRLKASLVTMGVA